MLEKEQKISAQRATILLAMSRTWNTLAGQTEQLEAIASAETDSGMSSDAEAILP
jgi:hypothetical protein